MSKDMNLSQQDRTDILSSINRALESLETYRTIKSNDLYQKVLGDLENSSEAQRVHAHANTGEEILRRMQDSLQQQSVIRAADYEALASWLQDKMSDALHKHTVNMQRLAGQWATTAQEKDIDALDTLTLGVRKNGDTGCYEAHMNYVVSGYRGLRVNAELIMMVLDGLHQATAPKSPPGFRDRV